MASQELIKNFQEKTKVLIDVNSVKSIFERLLTQFTDQKTREARMKAVVMQLYPEIAKNFEQKRMTDALYHSAEPSSTTAFEFFEGYMNIMSELAQETADELVARTNEDLEKATNAVNAAEAQLNEKITKDNTLRQNYLTLHKEIESLESNPEYIKEYKKPVESARIALTNAKDKKKAIVLAVPFKAEKVYFGMSAVEAKSLLEAQVKTTNYTEERRAQIESVGVRFSGFMTDLGNAFKTADVKYETADAEQKRAMQEVYATKKLMQEQLEKKTGGWFGWFWRLWYYRDVNAITKYIDEANQALGKAGFGADQAKEADDAMAKDEYFYNLYKASDAEKILEEKLVNNEFVAPVADNENDKSVEQSNEKDNLPPQDTEEMEKMRILNEFLTKEFRPSTSSKTLKLQRDALKTINELIPESKQKLFPKEVIHVLNANSKKMYEYRKLLARVEKEGPQVLGMAGPTYKAIEERLNNSVANYKPITFEELKAIAASVKDKNAEEINPEGVEKNGDIAKNENVDSIQKESVFVDLSDPREVKDVSAPVEEPNPLVKESSVRHN